MYWKLHWPEDTNRPWTQAATGFVWPTHTHTGAVLCEKKVKALVSISFVSDTDGLTECYVRQTSYLSGLFQIQTEQWNVGKYKCNEWHDYTEEHLWDAEEMF